MYLSVISDEVVPDIIESISHVKSMGLESVELRSHNGTSLLWQPDDVLRYISQQLKEADLTVCAFDTPIFKCDLDGTGARAGGSMHGSPITTLDQQFDLLERACDVAEIFETDMLRIFSFWRVEDPGTVKEAVADLVGSAAQRAKARGFSALVENEHDCNVSTCDEMAEMRDLVGDELRFIWDPGNEAKLGGHRGAEGYPKIRNALAHVQVKDLDDEGNWCPVGHGTVDFEEILKYLQRDNYDGGVSLETHCELVPGEGRVAASEVCIKALRNYADFEAH